MSKQHQSQPRCIDPDAARVLQSLEQGTEGFQTVLTRLNGTSEHSDFIRPITLTNSE